jgi:hypothetical protein
MKLSSILLIVALGDGLNLANAQSFISNLDAAQDGGGARTGTGSVGLTLSGTTLSLSLGSYSGLSGNVTAAHIHGPGAPGVGANVLYGLIPTFITSGTNFGIIAAGNINLVDNAGGLGFTVAQQLTQLNSGLWYVNIHTTTFGGGEIRGQIVLVPEPTSAALIVLGCVCTGVYLKRRYVRI